MDKTHLKKDILLGVIPARSGSKGIKNKNIKKVLGQPLISYTITDALTFRNLDRVIVTTDSPDIAKTAQKYGADVPFIRPKYLAADNTSMLKVLKHALVQCERIYAVRITGIMLLDPTSPLRNKMEIEEMVNVFLKKNPDLVLAVAPARKNPYFNMVKFNTDNYAQLALRGHYIRRQDAPKIYDITNNCWIFSRTAILRGSRIPKKTIPYEIKSPYIDIDSAEDFQLFECLLKMRKSS